MSGAIRREKAATTIPVNEATAKQVATQYIAEIFGPTYEVHTLFHLPEYWWVQIGCRHPALNHLLIVGSVRIDARTGQIIASSPDEIEDMRQRAYVMVAHQRKELARDNDGYILPYQAKIKVSAYMADTIAFFAGAEGQPEWVPDDPPVWRVNTALRLRGHGKVCELGFIDLNAVTGEIIRLTDNDIAARQKRARHAAEAIERSAAPTC